MGFRAAALFVSCKSPGYFGTSPKSVPARVPRVCGILGISKAKRLGPTEFLNAIYPPRGQFALGVYEGGFVYASQDLFNDSPEKIYEKLKNKILRDYQPSQALVIQLHSVTNTFGYALFHDEDLVRAYCGDIDSDVTTDVGVLQWEEKPHFANSRIKGGKRFFRHPSMPLWEFNAPAYGEELVFAMTARFLGTPLNMAMPSPLEVELFQKV